MKRLLPWLWICLSLGITVGLWWFSKRDGSLVFSQPLQRSSQLFALAGTVLMAITLLLSTRINLLEDAFGGLDKIYKVHRVLGSVGFLLLLNHPLFLVFQSFPQTILAEQYLFLSESISYNLGILSIYIALFSFFFMMFMRLPYHIWQWTHRLLGLSFILGGAHAMLIPSDIASNLALRVWMLIWIAIGMLSAIYSTIIAYALPPRFFYSVICVDRKKDVVIVTLSPVGKLRLNFTPGQFVYVQFMHEALGRERHPFSLASAPQESKVRIAAKMVGDYTRKLPLLDIGQKAVLYGPYGRFAAPQSKTVTMEQGTSLWIAGGIGVTPFLSMLRSEIVRKTKQNIVLYYIYRDREDGIFVHEIETIASRIQHLRFYACCSKEKGRLSIDDVVGSVDMPSVRSIYLCGPLAMMQQFSREFLRLGFSEDQVRYEEFAFV